MSAQSNINRNTESSKLLTLNFTAIQQSRHPGRWLPNAPKIRFPALLALHLRSRGVRNLAFIVFVTEVRCSQPDNSDFHATILDEDQAYR